jgi:arylsulfatase A-like enzyme
VLADGDPLPVQRPLGLRPNVLFVVSDTLRRDHLGTYGYSRQTSPRIDAFAASAVVFDRAYAQSPSTKPSMASVFTSLHPSAHRAVFNEHALADRFVTLAEVFAAASYETAGFTENPVVSGKFGYNQGFREYRIHKERHQRLGGPAKIFDRALADWLGRNAQREFFLYVHFVDPHSPYWAPKKYRGRFAKTEGPGGWGLDVKSSTVGDLAEALAKYDEEILFVDARFGALLDRIEELGLREETIVVFLSDHGEAFGEHGAFHHSRSVYAELIDVPFMISASARMKAGRRSEPVQHIDLFPTLLDLTGTRAVAAKLGVGDQLRGESLVDSNRSKLTGRSIVSEHLRGGWGRPARSIVSGDTKLIEQFDTGEFELYDLASDRGDTANRFDTAPAEERDRLVAEARAFVEAVSYTAAPEVQVSPEDRLLLQQLGYLPENEKDAGAAPLAP